MSNLDEFLKLELQGSPLEGASPLPSPERPTTAGLNWLAVPQDVAGLVYRFQTGSLDRLSVQGDTISVSASCALESGAVHMATSSDGRLLVVACNDGSLRCFDSTSASLTHRWTVASAHSHVTPDLQTPASPDRSKAAAASGPVRSLEFAPDGYEFLLVDNQKGVCIYNAAMSSPSNLIPPTNAASAAWGPSQFNNAIAVGNIDGSVEILRFEDGKLTPLSNLGCPNTDEDGFSCTHLQWARTSLLAGLCRVIPSDDEPDEDDEDDTAEHEAALFTTSIDGSSYKNSEWTDHGDVVPFFSVPKSGRHVFFTSFLNAAQNLLVVASNVGTEVGVVAEEDGQWQLVELQEGAAACTPTTEDDEYCYPVGLSIVQVESGSFQMILGATDGSVSKFSFQHETQPDCFAAHAAASASGVPGSPVEQLESSGPPELANEPAVDEAPKTVETKQPSTTGFSFGQTGATTTPGFAFGSAGSNTFSFGSTTPLGSSGATTPGTKQPGTSVLGSGASGPSPAAAPVFGQGLSYSFGSPGGSSFGTTSPLGASIAQPTATTKAPTFGSPGAAPVFGQGSSVFGSGTATGGGFGALSSSGKVSSSFGSGKGFGSFGATSSSNPSPFSSSNTNPRFGATTAAVDPGEESDVSEKSTDSEDTPQPAARPTSNIPAFGSGSKAPTFSFSSPSSSQGFGAITPASQSQFGAFGSPSNPGLQAMAKPLFGTKPTQAQAPPATKTEASGGGGFSFGSTSSPAPAPGSGGFSFGSTSSATSAAGKSGASIGGFSFGAPSTGAAAGGVTFGTAAGKAESSASPFGAFGSSGASSSGAQAMAKPLFGTQPTEIKAPAKTEDKSATEVPPKAPSPQKAVPAVVPTTAAGKRAAEVFDTVDTAKSGSLPASSFEELLEEIGSSFHGDEYDAQLGIIDPSGSGTIKRAAFIDWYTNFVEGDDGDDGGSLDTEEREERAEEEGRAKEAFGKLGEVASGVLTIPASSFGELMESLGTTYCEEEHRSTLKKLTKPDGNIHESDFLTWYVDWLFGGDESDSDDEDDADDDDKAGESSAPQASLSSIFKVDKDSWRCEVCSVPNSSDENKCAACETPRPGFEGQQGSSDKGASNPASGAIGSGGFTFGAAGKGSSIGAGGFSFGATPSPAPASGGGGGFSFGATSSPAPAPGSGGFSFGSTSSATSAAGKPGASTGGFSFGAPSTGAAAGGFTFGTAAGKAESSASPFGVFGSSGASSSGAQAMAKPLFGTKPTEIKAPAKTEDKSATEVPPKALSPQKAVPAVVPTTAAGKRAAEVFDTVDTAKSGSLPASSFEELLEEIGSSFHGDEYDAQLGIIDPSGSGTIKRAAFIDWYTNFVEVDDGDDGGSLDTEEREERAEEEGRAKEAFGKLGEVVSGVLTIPASSFGELMESLGTTYCEEEHRSTLKKLTKPDGNIHESDFLTWYVDWLFGGDESDSDDEDDADDDDKAGESSAPQASLSSIFKVDKDSWRCEVCSVPNSSDGNKCAACETPRPGFEGQQGSSDMGASNPASGAIGSGGFTFGAAGKGSSIGAGGFSFGATPSPAPASGGGGGFSFGATSSPAPAPGSGGFSFGSTSSATSAAGKSGASTSGFSFGAPSSATPSGGFSFGTGSGKGDSSNTTPFSSKTTNRDDKKDAAGAPKSSPSSGSASSYPPMSSKAPTPFGVVAASSFKSAGATTPFGASGQSASSSKTQSSSAYPPLSTKAPTPFGGAPAKPTKSPASSGAYPPMASKAPTPFGATGKSTAVEKTPSSTYPPMSAKAPTPFGGATAKSANTAASSGAYPPMASKAPSPFGASVQSSAVTKAPSSSTYPPLSTKAPTPFGGAQTKPTSTTAVGSSYPPLASKAPTPFGASGQPATSSKAPTSSAYPPMSAKAPTPFGGAPAKTTKTTATSGSYPPMATKAPTPFGATSQSAATNKTPSSSSYPPMSSKAPTPFGSPAAKSPSSASSSGAYPPMAAKAPTPFGAAGQAATKTSSPSSSYPPMSSKAPTPFGSTQTKPTKSASSGGAYPPMAAKAPTPFGGTGQSTAVTKTPSSSSSSSYPPLSSKAPTPFGSTQTKPTNSAYSSGAYPPMASKAPTPFGASGQSAATSKAASSSAYPPLSAKAPTPFGGAPAKPSKNDSSGSAYPPVAAKAPTPFGASVQPAAANKTPSSSSYPPLSTKAPTPFGSATKPTNSASSGGAYPPLAAKAPTPFSGAQGKQAAGAKLSQPSPTSTVSGSAPSTPPASVAPNAKKTRGIRISRATGKMSKTESEFASETDKMEQVLDEVSRSHQLISANTGADFEEKINKLVTAIQDSRISLLDTDASLVNQKKENTFLVGRKTDSSRQVNEARRLVDNLISTAKGSSTMVETQPLDYESEQRRRKFAPAVMTLKEQLDLLERRSEMLDRARDGDARNVLLRVSDLYQKVKTFDSAIMRIEGKTENVAKSVPLSSNKQPAVGRSTYGLDLGASGSKRQRPRALFSPTRKPAKKQNETSLSFPVASTWRSVEACLEDMGTENASTVRIAGFTRLRTSAPVGDGNRVTRQLGASLLLSPTKQTPTRPPASTTSISLYSPSPVARPRSGWDRPSSVDQNRTKQMSLGLPTKLNEVSVSEMSRPMLTAVGTTPEKIQASLEVKRSGGRSSSRQQKITPSTTSKSTQSSTPSSKLSEPKKSSAGFPPMPTKAPTPVSEQMAKASKPTKASSGYPPLSAKAPKPFSAQSSKEPVVKDKPKSLVPEKPSGSSNDKPKSTDGGISGLGGMKGLGDSLFSASSSAANSGPMLQATSSSTEPDYASIMTSFYQKHNPAKVGEVAKTLEKYKGREAEMFKKLAARYKAPNPLDNLKLGGNSEGSVQSPMPSLSQSAGAPSASPFSTGPPTLNAPSPFSGSSAPGTSASSSPFGKPPAPGGFGAPSPFGKPMTSASPFGSTGMSTASSSPFGNPTQGMASPSPFGSPAPSAPAPLSQPSNQTFNGRTARELLLSFYQQRNPSKVAEVDKLLAKYSGNEEHMFRNLAKKYKLDPSVFGLAPAPAAGGFGNPQKPAAPSFGHQSPLGGGGATFGQSSGFGQKTAPPAGFGTGGQTFGAAGGSALGSSFGSLAQTSTPSPFGSPAPTFGAPSGFGSPAGSFGSPTPFGAPRR